MRLTIEHCRDLIILPLMPVGHRGGARRIGVLPVIASGDLQPMQVMYTVRTVFAPKRVVAHIWPSTERAALNVDGEIATGKFCYKPGDGASR